MVKQINLFPNQSKHLTNHAHKKNSKQKQQPLSAVDKIYRKMGKIHVAQENNIYQGGSACRAVALSYINNGNVYGDTMKVIYQRSLKTKPHQYYHFIKGYFLHYDTWIMKQILETEVHRNE